MPYEVFLAFRYLRSRHKRRLARVTSIAAILGICMGVGALIVAFALSNGFRDEMREKILQGTSHISILRTDGRPIENYSELANRLKQVDGVVSASPTTYDAALARGSKDSGYAVIRGIENESGQSAQVNQWLIEGSSGALFGMTNEPNALVGSDLASRIGVSVGDPVQIVPASDLSNVRTHRWRVAGIFRSGLFEYDSAWIYVGLDNATALAGNNHVAANIAKVLGEDYELVDWQQANQPLFSALALERRMGLFIIGLIIAVAALNITTMLILVVVERRRDIAILNALGATRTGVMLLFVIEGAVVGAVGAVAGVVLGLIACFIANHYKLVSLPADVYSISNVPLISKPLEILLAALIAFALSVLATIYPARAASRMRPVEALRDS
jgi:lipoprotein-releasing system permease protein